MSFDTEASLFPSLTRAMMSLSVGTIVERLVGRVAFSNGYKKRPVCCFRVMVAFFSLSKAAIRMPWLFWNVGDVCWRALCLWAQRWNLQTILAYAIRKHKPPCVSHGIIKVQKVTSQVLFLWNATPSAHPATSPHQDRPVSHQQPRTCCLRPGLPLEAQCVLDGSQRVTVLQSM